MSFLELVQKVKDFIEQSRIVSVIAFISGFIRQYFDENKDGAITVLEITEALKDRIPDSIQTRYGVDSFLDAVGFIYKAMQALHEGKERLKAG